MRVADYLVTENGREFSDKTVEAVNEWLQANKTPVFYDEKTSTFAHVTKTGYNLISGDK